MLILPHVKNYIKGRARGLQLARPSRALYFLRPIAQPTILILDGPGEPRAGKSKTGRPDGLKASGPG